MGKMMYLRNVTLNQTLGGESWTPPSIVYIVLSLNDFDPNADRGTCTEVTGGTSGYTPVAVACNATNFPPSEFGSISNGTVFTFPTAMEVWGEIHSFYIADAGTSGNLLYGGQLTVNRTVGIGDSPSFDINALELNEVA